MGRKLENDELNRPAPEELVNLKRKPVVAVLDNVRSLHNVGSVFRTCDAFLIEKILLCGVTGQPPDREIEKTALGATRTVPWQYFSSTLNAVQLLKSEGYFVVSVEQAENSISLAEWRPGSRPIAVVFGNEVHGVAQEVVDACDAVIEIPQWGSKHSLNISVCAGIVLWELGQKLP